MPNPQLLFLAGPNGAGKSTFSKMLSEDNALIFDIDKVIARIESERPGISKKQLYDEGTAEFFRQATEAVRLKRHFTLETNFRDESLVDIAAQFKGYGYTTNLVYLTLSYIDQSTSRVNERVGNGGHYVDRKNIELNFDLGLQQLENHAGQFDKLEIVDASNNGYRLRRLLIVQNQILQYISSDLPPGISDTVEVIARRFGWDNGIDPIFSRRPKR